jgi:hypothetical protein
MQPPGPIVSQVICERPNVEIGIVHYEGNLEDSSKVNSRKKQEGVFETKEVIDKRRKKASNLDQLLLVDEIREEVHAPNRDQKQ